MRKQLPPKLWAVKNFFQVEKFRPKCKIWGSELSYTEKFGRKKINILTTYKGRSINKFTRWHHSIDSQSRKKNLKYTVCEDFHCEY